MIDLATLGFTVKTDGLKAAETALKNLASVAEDSADKVTRAAGSMTTALSAQANGLGAVSNASRRAAANLEKHAQQQALSAQIAKAGAEANADFAQSLAGPAQRLAILEKAVANQSAALARLAADNSRATQAIANSVNAVVRAAETTNSVLQRMGSQSAATVQVMQTVGAVGERAFTSTAKGVTQAASATDVLNAGVSRLGSTFSNLETLVVRGFLGVQLARAVFDIADSYTKLTGTLRIATESFGSYGAALDSVRQISTVAQADVNQVANFYARLARNTQDLGINQQQLGVITENVALALKTQGNTTVETNSVLLQLSQSFASGVLRGEEFNTLSENGAVLLDVLAESIGVARGELRGLAEQGALTAPMLAKAYGDEALLEKFRRQAQDVQTISGAFTNLRNQLVLLIGEQGKTSGAISGISGAVNALANNLELVINSATVLGAAFASVKLGQFASSMAEAVVVARAKAVADQAAAQAAVQAAAATAAQTNAEVFNTQAKVAQAAANTALLTQELALVNAKVQAAAAAVAAARGTAAENSAVVALNIALQQESALRGQVVAATASENAARAGNVAAVNAQTAAARGLATATTAAATAGTLASRALGLLGGPIGLVVTGLGLAATAWAAFSSAAEDSTNKVNSLDPFGQLLVGARELNKELDQAIRKNQLLLDAKNRGVTNLGDPTTVRVLEQEAKIQAEIVRINNERLAGRINEKAAIGLLIPLSKELGELQAANQKRLQLGEQLAAKTDEEKYKTLVKTLDQKKIQYEQEKQLLDTILASGKIEKAEYNERLRQIQERSGLFKEGKKEVDKYEQSVAQASKQIRDFIFQQTAIAETGKEATAFKKLENDLLEQFNQKLPNSVRLLLEQAKAAFESAEATKEKTKALEEERKAREKLDEEATKELEKVRESNAKLEKEINSIGLKGEALAELEVQYIKTAAAAARLASEEAFERGDFFQASEALQRAEELEKQIGLIRTKYAKESAQQLVEENRKANVRIVDDIVDIFGDIAVRGGKDVGQRIVDSIKISLAKATFRIAVQAALGVDAQGQATGGGLLGAVGGGVGQSLLQSAITNGFTAALSSSAAYAAAVPGLTSAAAGSQAAMLAAQTGSFGAAGTAATAAAGGSAAAGFASTAMAAAPYIAAAVLAYNVLRSKKTPATSLGGADFLFGPGGSLISSTSGDVGGNTELVRNIVNPIATQYNSIVQALDGVAQAITVTAGGNTGRNGQNPNFSIRAGINNQTFEIARESQLNEANLAAESLRTVITLLQQTAGLAPNIEAVIDSIDATSASFDQLSVALQQAQNVAAANKLFEDMGGALSTLSGASAETINGFLNLTGGLEKFAGGLTAFNEAFLTEQQKTDRITKSVTDAFAEFNQQVPTTREGLVELVNGLNLQDESQAKLYATILELTPALDQLLPAFEAVTAEVKAATEAAMNEAADRKQRLNSERAVQNQVAEAVERVEQAFKSLNAEAERTALVFDAIKLSNSEISANAGLVDFLKMSLQEQATLEKMGRSSGEIQGLINEALSKLSANVVQTRLLAGEVSSAFKEAFADRVRVSSSLRNALQSTSSDAGRLVLREQLEISKKFAANLSESALAVPNFTRAFNDAIAGIGFAVTQINELDIQDAVDSFATAGEVIRGTISNLVNSNNSLSRNIPNAQGVLGIRAAREQLAQAQRGFNTGLIVNSLGNTLREVSSLEAGFRSGAVAAEDFSNAIEFVNKAIGTEGLAAPELRESIQQNIESIEANAGAIQAAGAEYTRFFQATQLFQAGLSSANFYFKQISETVDNFNQVASSTAPALDSVTDAIGRFQSAADIFKESAEAIREGLLAGGDTTANNTLINSEAVSKAAQDLAKIVTTRAAAEAERNLAGLESFQGLGDAVLRDISLLVQDIAAFDTPALEATFLRLSDALNEGQVNLAQYNDLLEYSKDVYLQLPTAAEKAAEAIKISQEQAAQSAVALAERIKQLEQALDDATRAAKSAYDVQVSAVQDALAQVEQAQQAVLDAQRRQIESQVSGLEEQLNLIQTRSGAFDSFLESISDFRKGLLIESGLLNSQQRQIALRAQFNRASQLARGGDIAALGQVQGLASDLVQEIANNSVDPVQFAKEFATLNQSLIDTEKAAQQQKAQADSQAFSIQSQIASLQAQTVQRLKTIEEAQAELIVKQQQLKEQQAILSEADKLIAENQLTSLLGLEVKTLGVIDAIYAVVDAQKALNLQVQGATSSLQSQINSVAATVGSVPQFATGGLVTNPTLAMIGEGSMNEAIVPLPNGRAIPVQMFGQGQQANAALVDEIRALRQEVSQLRAENSAENRAIVGATSKTAQVLVKVSENGDSFYTEPR